MKNSPIIARVKSGGMTRRNLIRNAAATASTAALLTAIKGAFPGGVFAQGAGPEVKGTKLGYIALTDAAIR